MLGAVESGLFLEEISFRELSFNICRCCSEDGAENIPWSGSRSVVFDGGDRCGFQDFSMRWMVAVRRISPDRRGLCLSSGYESRSASWSVVVPVPTLPVAVSIGTRTIVSVDVSRIACLLSAFPAANESELGRVGDGSGEGFIIFCVDWVQILRDNII